MILRTPIKEPEVRELRDAVYGKPTSDDNWSYCREHWMRPEETQWLLDRLGERAVQIFGQLQIASTPAR